MEDKLKELQRKLDDFKTKQQKLNKKNTNPASTITDVAAELTAGVIVGVIIGLVFDNLFDSKPLFLISCIILAVIAAFRSIWKKYIK